MIGKFFGVRDAANWHEKWGILAFGTELLVLGALAVSRAWAPAVLGQGAEEFRRLGRSLFTATVVLALGGIALTSRNIKLWIFVAIPAIALVIMTARYVLRLRLHRQRKAGRCLRPVLAAGESGHRPRSDHPDPQVPASRLAGGRGVHDGRHRARR